MLVYLVRFTIWAFILAGTAVLTATTAWWPAYLAGNIVLGFIPGAVLVETIPDLLEALADADWDFD